MQFVLGVTAHLPLTPRTLRVSHRCGQKHTKTPLPFMRAFPLLPKGSAFLKEKRMLLRGSDAVLGKRGRWAWGWVLSTAGSLVHGAASRSLRALLAQHLAAHLLLFSKPHPGACTVPSLGFPRTGAAHPQLQGRGFCVVRHCRLRSDSPTFPVVSSSASPNPSCTCFIHSSTYSALPYVQRQHSRKRSIPGGRGAPRACYRDMRAPALHRQRSRPRRHGCGRDRGASGKTGEKQTPRRKP